MQKEKDTMKIVIENNFLWGWVKSVNKGCLEFAMFFLSLFKIKMFNFHTRPFLDDYHFSTYPLCSILLPFKNTHVDFYLCPMNFSSLHGYALGYSIWNTLYTLAHTHTQMHRYTTHAHTHTMCLVFHQENKMSELSS